jgi:hypothetical protein
MSSQPLDIKKALGIKQESSFAWVAPSGFEALGVESGDVIIVDRSTPALKSSLCLYWNETGIEIIRGFTPGDTKKPWGVAVVLSRKI